MVARKTTTTMMHMMTTDSTSTSFANPSKIFFMYETLPLFGIALFAPARAPPKEGIPAGGLVSHAPASPPVRCDWSKILLIALSRETKVCN